MPMKAMMLSDMQLVQRLAYSYAPTAVTLRRATTKACEGCHCFLPSLFASMLITSDRMLRRSASVLSSPPNSPHPCLAPSLRFVTRTVPTVLQLFLHGLKVGAGLVCTVSLDSLDSL